MSPSTRASVDTVAILGRGAVSSDTVEGVDEVWVPLGRLDD